MNKIESLTEILPYVREFLGKTFVIKLGGEVCQGETLENIAQQISLIHHIGIRVLLVHGGGPQLSDLLEKLGKQKGNISQATIAGRRVTDQLTLDAAKMAFAGQISTNVVAALRRQGALAMGLSGVDAGLIDAVKRPPLEVVQDNGERAVVDFQFVGDVTSVKTNILEDLFKARIIPVLCSLAGDEQGQVYNVNADTLAAQCARALKAEKLILLTNVPGILRIPEDQTSVVSYIDIPGINSMIKDGTLSGGMRPKVEACVKALEGGVRRTHIINGNRSGSLLLELFLNEGVGTMVVEKLG